MNEKSRKDQRSETPRSGTPRSETSGCQKPVSGSPTENGFYEFLKTGRSWEGEDWKGILFSYRVPEPKPGFVDRILEEKKFQDLLQEHKVPEPSKGFVPETFAKVLKERHDLNRQRKALQADSGNTPHRAASLFQARILVFAAALAAILILTLILLRRNATPLVPQGNPIETAGRFIQPSDFPKLGSNPFSRVLASTQTSFLPPPPTFVDFDEDR